MAELNNDMSQNNKIIKILDFAISQEEFYRKLYANLSEKVEDDEVKNTLIELSKMEEKHKQKIEYMKTNFFNDSAKINNYDNIEIPESLDEEILTLSSPSDILKKALVFENNAKNLYQNLASKSNDDEVVRIFEMLSKEEAKHELLIENILTKL